MKFFIIYFFSSIFFLFSIESQQLVSKENFIYFFEDKNDSYSHVNRWNYEKYWAKSTFPTVRASISYHVHKHGAGRTRLQYTRDAVHFYEKNKERRKKFFLRDGTPAYKIKKGNKGGIWTLNGKIITYWD